MVAIPAFYRSINRPHSTSDPCVFSHVVSFPLSRPLSRPPRVARFGTTRSVRAGLVCPTVRPRDDGLPPPEPDFRAPGDVGLWEVALADPPIEHGARHGHVPEHGLDVQEDRR